MGVGKCWLLSVGVGGACVRVLVVVLVGCLVG